MTNQVISEAALTAAKLAVGREMRSRTYDRHAHDEEVFGEGVADIARAALEAAAPHMREVQWGVRDAAVEAALLTIAQPDHWLLLDDDAKVRDILEAAAPHMVCSRPHWTKAPPDDSGW